MSRKKKQQQIVVNCLKNTNPIYATTDYAHSLQWHTRAKSALKHFEPTQPLIATGKTNESNPSNQQQIEREINRSRRLGKKGTVNGRQ